MTSRSQTVLRLVRDERAATPALVAWKLGCSEEAARKLLERLERKRKLTSHRYGGIRYFTLHPRLARAWKVSLRRAGPMGRSGLLDIFGRVFSERLPGVARRFTPEEFKERFSGLLRPGMSSAGHYLDSSDGTARLGLVVVDRGQGPKRLIAKLHSIVSRRLGIDEFRELIEAGGFVLLLVTAAESKRLQLEETLRDRTPSAVDVRTETVPELELLLLAKGGRRG